LKKEEHTMTEQQLRQHVADIMTGWVGGTKGSAKHQEILSIYNGYKPLARGYTVKTTDAYCATTVSAAWIKAGIAAYTGTECGCGPFITIAKAKGIWVENDAYVPKLGDAVMYDWQDDGVGDNTGAPDHIGIVTKPGTATFTVTEGNMSGGKVGTRTMAVNGKYIRGFITPDYAAIAPKIAATATETATASNTTTTTTAATSAATKATTATTNKLQAAKSKDTSLAGTYTVNTNGATLNLRYGPGTGYGIIKALAKGTKVQNYGFYTEVSGVKWLYVKVGATVGFASAEYLKKA
jgi:hypothetical protein